MEKAFDMTNAKENGLTLELELDEDQVDKLKMQRETHLEVVRLRERIKGKRRITSEEDGTDGQITKEEEEEAAMISTFTNGTLFPAGKLNPNLLKLTSLTSTTAKGSRNSGKLGAWASRGDALLNNKVNTVHPVSDPGDTGSSNVETVDLQQEEIEDSWEDILVDSTCVDKRVRAVAAAVSTTSSKLDNHVPYFEVQTAELPVFILNADMYDEEKVMTPNQIASDIHEQLCGAREGLDEMLETLFESNVMFHSTNKFIERDLQKLGAIFPGTRFISVEYPAALYSESYAGMVLTQEVWSQVVEKGSFDEGGFASVAALKQLIIKCSRPLSWKLSILEEIDILVAKEEIAQLERQEILDRLESLEKLRIDILGIIEETDEEMDPELFDGLQDRLANVEESLEEAHGHFDILRLEQDQKRFSSIELSGKGDEEMRIVDMILAMVLQRCDLIWDMPKTKEEFYTGIAHEHNRILKLWLSDFGRVI